MLRAQRGYVVKAFPPRERQGLYRAIVSQRATHAFRPDPVPNLILARVLRAAQCAPSFGLPVPWKFILVQDVGIRKRIDSLAESGAPRGDRQEPPAERAAAAPIMLCVTCSLAPGSPKRSAIPGVRGSDFLSLCGAVQNLWLAARAEGLGVAWTDVASPEALREILDIPPGVLPVALLALGFSGGPGTPSVADKAPDLRRDSSEVLYVNRWGARADAEPFFPYLHDQALLS